MLRQDASGWASMEACPVSSAAKSTVILLLKPRRQIIRHLCGVRFQRDCMRQKVFNRMQHGVAPSEGGDIEAGKGCADAFSC